MGIEGIDLLKANLDYTPREEVISLGRKIGKVGLTADDKLYISEDVNPQDAERAEKLSEKDLNKRVDDLLHASGWKH